MPASGDDFLVMETEADAREVATNRLDRYADKQRALAAGPISLEEFAKRASNQAAEELNVILKADVQGSVEAVKHSIEKLSGDKVKVRVLHAAVGGVNESDVQLAIASRAIIVGFGVRAEPRAMADAEQLGVQVRFYRVIYELLDDVKNAMVGLLEPLKEESSLGRVEVRDTFTIPKVGTIAGCYVTGGMIRRNAQARLLRDSRVIHEGKMSSLRRFKDDVKEVQAGFECGIGLEGFNDVKIGDVIEVYELKEIAPTLD
jgi:translation initiation factor IF-2